MNLNDNTPASGGRQTTEALTSTYDSDTVLHMFDVNSSVSVNRDKIIKDITLEKIRKFKDMHKDVVPIVGDNIDSDFEFYGAFDVLAEEMLYDVSKAIVAHNSVAAKGQNWRGLSELANSQVAELIKNLFPVKVLITADNYNDKGVLCVLINDPEDRLYGKLSSSRYVFENIIRKFKFTATRKDINEIIYQLMAEAPRISVEKSNDLIAAGNDDNDLISVFFDEYRTRFKWDHIPFSYLFSLYKAWIRNENLSVDDIDDRKFAQTIKDIVIYDDIWTVPDNQENNFRIPKKMKNVPEPLICVLGAEDLYNPHYKGLDPDRLCIPDFKDRPYRGIMHKRFAKKGFSVEEN